MEGSFTKLPQHVAIAMDGNGRWAEKQGMPRVKGHQRGAECVRTISEACIELGIPYLTLWAFSTENWRRPLGEVYFIMGLLKRMLKNELGNLKKNQIRLRVIGNRHRLSSDLGPLIDQAVKETAAYDRLHLTIALDYGGRDDIMQAFQSLGCQIVSGQLSPQDITEDLIARHLATADLPDPDLFIRPGGVVRLSNYLIWQFAYTELYFTDTLWPDFSSEELLKAVSFFQKVERRFGGLASSQVAV